MIPLDELDIERDTPIGWGALGEVWRATWNGSIQVAVKCLYFMSTDQARIRAMGGPFGSATRQATLRAFIKECSINASLRHPNIVMFLGVGIERSASNEPRYLVLELMEGGSLHDEIYPNDVQPREGAPMALERIVSILLDLARALVYLHSREPPVLHLDLKPKNVLLDRSGTAKIGDLGEAHVIQSAQRGATRGAYGVGTLDYMAPEVAAPDRERGPPADMFSLGVMACEMSSGRPPNPSSQPSPESRRAADIAAIRHPQIRQLVCSLLHDDERRRWDARHVQLFLERERASSADRARE